MVHSPAVHLLGVPPKLKALPRPPCRRPFCEGTLRRIMYHALVTILIVCIVVFIIERFLKPEEPWRSVFRFIAVAIAIVLLLQLLLGPVIW